MVEDSIQFHLHNLIFFYTFPCCHCRFSLRVSSVTEEAEDQGVSLSKQQAEPSAVSDSKEKIPVDDLV